VHDPRPPEIVERLVDPLGLVAKGRAWYVVAAVEGDGDAGPGGSQPDQRAYRVARIRAAEILEQPCVRPLGFDLGAYWERATAAFKANVPRYDVTVRVSPVARPLVQKSSPYRRVPRRHRDVRRRRAPCRCRPNPGRRGMDGGPPPVRGGGRGDPVRLAVRWCGGGARAGDAPAEGGRARRGRRAPVRSSSSACRTCSAWTRRRVEKARARRVGREWVRRDRAAAGAVPFSCYGSLLLRRPATGNLPHDSCPTAPRRPPRPGPVPVCPGATRERQPHRAASRGARRARSAG
jgi:hypothetical protein